MPTAAFRVSATLRLAICGVVLPLHTADLGRVRRVSLLVSPDPPRYPHRVLRLKERPSRMSRPPRKPSRTPYSAILAAGAAGLLAGLGVGAALGWISAAPQLVVA